MFSVMTLTYAPTPSDQRHSIWYADLPTGSQHTQHTYALPLPLPLPLQPVPLPLPLLLPLPLPLLLRALECCSLLALGRWVGAGGQFSGDCSDDALF